MVKRRIPYTTATVIQPTKEQIEAFASSADGGPLNNEEQAAISTLDPDANRDYKAIRVPFNKYEFLKLEEVARKTGRTKLNVIRWAIFKLADSVQKES